MELFNHKSSSFFCNQESNHNICIALEQKYKGSSWTPFHGHLLSRSSAFIPPTSTIFFHASLFKKFYFFQMSWDMGSVSQWINNYSHDLGAVGWIPKFSHSWLSPRSIYTCLQLSFQVKQLRQKAESSWNPRPAYPQASLTWCYSGQQCRSSLPASKAKEEPVRKGC